MKNEIKVYVGYTCAECNKVKSWLNDNGYEYEVIEPAEGIEYLASIGVRKVPYTTINGVGFMGFKPNEMKEILEGYK